MMNFFTLLGSIPRLAHKARLFQSSLSASLQKMLLVGACGSWFGSRAPLGTPAQSWAGGRDGHGFTQSSAAPTRMEAAPSQNKRKRKNSNSGLVIDRIDLLGFPVLSVIPVLGDPQKQNQIIKYKARIKPSL